MKDPLGNELEVGQLVAIQLQTPLISGRILTIEQGGLITGLRGGGERVQMAKVIVQSIHTIEVDPRLGLVGPIMVLKDPAPPVIEALPEVKDEEAKPN